MVKIPDNFDGKKFSDKFGISIEKFYVYRGELITQDNIVLSEADLEDCISLKEDDITFVELMNAIIEQELNGNKDALKMLAKKYDIKNKSNSQNKIQS